VYIQANTRHAATTETALTAPPDLAMAGPACSILSTGCTIPHTRSVNITPMQGVNLRNTIPHMVAQAPGLTFNQQVYYNYPQQSEQQHPQWQFSLQRDMLPDVNTHHHANTYTQPRPVSSMLPGPFQGMHAYPTHVQSGNMNMLNTAISQDHFNIPNTNHNPQIMPPARMNQLGWQLQSSLDQNRPAGGLAGYQTPAYQMPIHQSNRPNTSLPSTAPVAVTEQSPGVPGLQIRHLSQDTLAKMHEFNVPDMGAPVLQYTKQTYATEREVPGASNNPGHSPGRDSSGSMFPEPSCGPQGTGLRQALDLCPDTPMELDSRSPLIRAPLDYQSAVPGNNLTAPNSLPQPPIDTAPSAQLPWPVASMVQPVDRLQSPDLPLPSNLPGHVQGQWVDPPVGAPTASTIFDFPGCPYGKASYLESSGSAAGTVAVFQGEWGTFNGEVHRGLDTMQSPKRKKLFERSEVAADYELASRSGGARPEKRARQQEALPTDGRSRTESVTVVPSGGGMETLIPPCEPGILPTSKDPVGDVIICQGLEASTLISHSTSTNHNTRLTNATATNNNELAITKVNFTATTSSSSNDANSANGDEVIITGVNTLTPPPSASPPVKNSTKITAALAPSEPFFPKSKGKTGGRTTTYTATETTPEGVRQANYKLTQVLPLPHRKRWITNPGEFPRLERPMEQNGIGEEQGGGDPDAVFEVDELGRSINVVPAPAMQLAHSGSSYQLQSTYGAAPDPVGERSEEVNPYKDADDEVSWQGSGELVVEEGVSHVHSIYEKAAPVPTPIPAAPIPPPKKGRRVKLTEAEKKTRRKQRDRERYQRKKEEASRLRYTQNTPPKKPARGSPTAPRKAGVAKRTPAKSHKSGTPAPTDDDEDEDGGDFDIWEQLAVEIQKLPPGNGTAEVEVDMAAGRNPPVEESDEGKKENAGGVATLTRDILPPGLTDSEGEVNYREDGGDDDGDDDEVNSLFEE